MSSSEVGFLEQAGPVNRMEFHGGEFFTVQPAGFFKIRSEMAIFPRSWSIAAMRSRSW